MDDADRERFLDIFAGQAAAAGWILHAGATPALADARSFDTRYRLGNWTLGTLINKTHTWFDDDNLNLITDNLAAGNNRVFGYDELHRLTVANGPWGTGGYSYDLNGNRLSKTEGSLSATYAYTPGSNHVESAVSATPGEGGSFKYDRNGNITFHTEGAPGGSSSVYSYSQRDRLSLVDNGIDFQTGYDYSGDGARTRKDFSFIFFARLLLFSAEGNLLTEYNPDGIPPAGPDLRDHLWIPGSPENIARVDRVGTTDTLYFTHSDHLETPVAMTNTAGAFVWRVEHRPFGGIFSQSVATITNNLRFPGQYFDAESGLAQNGFRDYSEKLGRYIEPDPKRNQALVTVNLKTLLQTNHSPAILSMNSLSQYSYSYSENNPLSFIDPFGLNPWPWGDWGGQRSIPRSREQGYEPSCNPSPTNCSQYPKGSAPWRVCQSTPDSPWSNCVRACLLARYPNSSTLEYYINDHAYCFVTCRFGIYDPPPGYPNPADYRRKTN